MTRSSQRENVPPRITAEQAIALVKRQADRCEQIALLRYDDSDIDAWESHTEAVLTSAFGLQNGELHPNTERFKYAHRGELHVNMADIELQRNHVETQRLRKALLESYAEQLRDLAASSTIAAENEYRLHEAIERCSGQLLRDGHYKQAAFEAYICVIEAVKAKSKLRLDGDALMNSAFGCDNRTPVLQMNDLRTDADRDEQKGFMFLFKGVVGLRNSKAHSNRLFTDPARAHEYLALASLLLRILENASVNRVERATA